MRNVLKKYSTPDVRVLLVEDDEFLTEVLEEAFHQEGFFCKSVRATEDVLALVSEFKPNLVLLDYILPKMNGGELCSQIKQDIHFCKIPVMIYSAYSKVLLSLGDYGCDAFLEKPFDLEELLEKIIKLSKHRSNVTLISTK